MEPAKFGPFLQAIRKQRGLTQKQLAERLRVSGAAVSKWENGKCLPDLAKIGDLADVLDLSVLELMKGEIHGAGELPASRQAMSEVFSETVKTMERRNRRCLVLVVSAALYAAALVCLLHRFPVYHIPQVTLECYTAKEVSLLLHPGSREERQVAQTVLDQAERAFSDLSLSREEAEERYGLLGGYCIDKDRGVSAETHRLELWAVRLYGDYGYMWVYYSREGLDETGETVTGSWNIPTLWRIGKGWDGHWAVKEITESP